MIEQSQTGRRRSEGGYVLSDCEGAPQVLLLATGTEVPIVLQAQEKLAAEGIKARVVSMPCFQLFDLQDASYRESVLPKSVTARVACEAGIRLTWDKYIGSEGKICRNVFVWCIGTIQPTL